MVGEGDAKAPRGSKARLALLVALLGPVLPVRAEDKVEPTALQNPILRSHFRDQFLSLHSAVEPHRTPSRFAQTFVDRQIRHFLGRVEEKLGILESSVAGLDEIRRQVTEGENGLDVMRVGEWKNYCREVSSTAGDLRHMLSVIFLQLRSKDDFRARLNRAENNVLFEVELRELKRDKTSAVRLIRSYLFHAGSTVHITDLRHTNMLILLYHIQQRARLLQRKI